MVLKLMVHFQPLAIPGIPTKLDDLLLVIER
jgi:hypothetical protein